MLFVIGIIGWLIILSFAGFVFSQLWLWFIVPLGVPVIGSIQGAGIILVLGLARLKIPEPENDYIMEDLARDLIKLFLGIVVIFAFGWFFNQLM